jgi:hypothetical protein
VGIFYQQSRHSKSMSGQIQSVAPILPAAWPDSFSDDTNTVLLQRNFHPGPSGVLPDTETTSLAAFSDCIIDAGKQHSPPARFRRANEMILILMIKSFAARTVLSGAMAFTHLFRPAVS